MAQNGGHASHAEKKVPWWMENIMGKNKDGGIIDDIGHSEPRRGSLSV